MDRPNEIRMLALTCCVFTGCTTVSLGSLRSTWTTDGGLQMECTEVPNSVDALNEILRHASDEGQRVAMVGQRTTSFFGLSTSKPILCLERRLGAPSQPAARSNRAPVRPPAPVERPAAPAAPTEAEEEEEATPSTPAATSAAPGTLGIMSLPAGATITLDGKEIGRTPLMVKAVAAGQHTVTANWPDGKTATITHEVPAGKTTTARLSP